MSRVSIRNRIATVKAAAARIDPMAVAIQSLPAHLKGAHDAWLRENDALRSKWETEPGASYEALADGLFDLYPMPPVIADRLGVDTHVNLSGSEQDLADRYRAMVDERH